MRDRQPQSFDRKQVELMLSQTKPGDRILYTSTMCMAYYFLHGAMQRGAVYYHPSFAGTKVETDWLRRSDLRFAVTYNPTVYHPAYDGLDEKDQCISVPEFRYSPLGGRRAHHPVNREGFIRAADFRWVQVELQERSVRGAVRVLVKNPGGLSELRVALVDGKGEIMGQGEKRVLISPKWNGWVDMGFADSTMDPRGRFLRIVLPRGDSGFGIGGVSLGDGQLNWPWGEGSNLEVMPGNSGSEKISMSFDADKILPASGDEQAIRVLNDSGSSVLFQVR
jgi:hypothetical protein